MKLVIIRGIPGSGKTTKAKELVKEHFKKPIATAIICSADQYFVNPSSGKYEFDPKKLGLAHTYCRGKVEAALELGIELVILDNTNTQRWEYQPYIDLAETHKYECEQYVVGTLEEKDIKIYANRCVHGVPLESIRRMAKRFQL